MSGDFSQVPFRDARSVLGHFEFHSVYSALPRVCIYQSLQCRSILPELAELATRHPS